MEEVQVQSQGGKIYFGACARRLSFPLCGGEGSIYLQLISSMEKKMEKVTKSREDKQGRAPVDGTGKEHGWEICLRTLRDSISLLEVPTRAELATYYK